MESQSVHIWEDKRHVTTDETIMKLNMTISYRRRISQRRREYIVHNLPLHLVDDAWVICACLSSQQNGYDANLLRLGCDNP